MFIWLLAALTFVATIVMAIASLWHAGCCLLLDLIWLQLTNCACSLVAGMLPSLHFACRQWCIACKFFRQSQMEKLLFMHLQVGCYGISFIYLYFFSCQCKWQETDVDLTLCRVVHTKFCAIAWAWGCLRACTWNFVGGHADRGRNSGVINICIQALYFSRQINIVCATIIENTKFGNRIK